MAVTATGTFCRLSSRRVAVTTTSASAVGSLLVAAAAAACAPVAKAALARMSPAAVEANSLNLADAII